MQNKYSNYKIAWQPEKLKALRDKRVTSPIVVRIKPINACQHQCRWCTYHGTSSMHGDFINGSRINGDRLVALPAELARCGVKCITWTGGGEPLLHPQFVKANEHALECGLATSVITNGQILSESRAEILRHAKWIRVSVDYWDTDSFMATGRGTANDFIALELNLKRFAIIGQHYQRCMPKPDFGANVIVTKENHEHLCDIADWLKGLGMDNVRFSPVWVDNFLGYHWGIRPMVYDQLTQARFLESSSFKVFDSYNIASDQFTRSNHRCYYQEICPVIGADGTVYRCKDQAYTKAGALGSILDTPFDELWLSKDVQEKLHSFDPSVFCQNMQCAAWKKNELIEHILDASTDNFL